jgi:hypothetical protein
METRIMIILSKRLITSVCLGLSLLISNTALGADDPTPDALEILNRTALFMEKQTQFLMTATVWEDVVSDNNIKLQSTRVVEVKRRLPNKFRADVYTTQLDGTYAYDGKMMTVVKHTSKAYGEFTAPDTLRETLDVIQEKRGINLPLEDIFFKRPFYDAAEAAKSSQYIGKASVLGKQAHHLAFQHENIDWQLWIQTGPVPVVLKSVINYKTEQSSPQMIVIFDKWDFATELPDYVFDVYLSSNYERFNVRSLENTK